MFFASLWECEIILTMFVKYRVILCCSLTSSSGDIFLNSSSAYQPQNVRRFLTSRVIDHEWWCFIFIYKFHYSWKNSGFVPQSLYYCISSVFSPPLLFRIIICLLGERNSRQKRFWESTMTKERFPLSLFEKNSTSACWFYSYAIDPFNTTPPPLSHPLLSHPHPQRLWNWGRDSKNVCEQFPSFVRVYFNIVPQVALFVDGE